MNEINPYLELENNLAVTKEMLNGNVDDFCALCVNNILIRKVGGPVLVKIKNNSVLKAEYRVMSVNKFIYRFPDLDGFVNWKIVNDFTGKTSTLINTNHVIEHSYMAHDNGVLYKIYAYIQSPIEEVCRETWVKKSYRRLIGTAVDNGNETVSDIFSFFCRFYLERYEKYEEYDDWTSTENISEMLEAIVDFLYEDKGRLDSLDFARKQKIVNHFDVGSSLQNAGEFDNQWDKLLHFLAGVYHSNKIGDWWGYEVGFLNEGIDDIKRAWGEMTNTREPHQVGFDWKDFAWTAAGSHFNKLVVDAPTSEQGLNLIKAFANKKLIISDIFSADNIPAGHSYFHLRYSPGFETTIDLVDKELLKMRKIIENEY